MYFCNPRRFYREIFFLKKKSLNLKIFITLKFLGYKVFYCGLIKLSSHVKDIAAAFLTLIIKESVLES